MADTKLFDDIYAISLKRLIRLNSKIDKDVVQESIKKSLDFLGIENFEEINKCTEALLKAFNTRSGNSSTISIIMIMKLVRSKYKKNVLG